MPDETRFVIGFDGSVDGSASIFMTDGEQWTNLGYTVDGGAGYHRSYTDHRPVRNAAGGVVVSDYTQDRGAFVREYLGIRPPPPSGAVPVPADADGPGHIDILDQIDAAVAGASSDECGCGCGRLIPAGHVSRDFADEACQARWYRRQATPEAAPVYHRPGRQRTEPPVEEEPPPALRHPEHLPSCADLYGAGYRRHCDRCDQHVIPDVYMHNEADIHSWGNPEVITTHSTPFLRCPNCDNDLPAPAYIATIEHSGRAVVLRLSDGSTRVQQTIPVGLAENGGQTLAASIWRRLERELRRFSRNWLGRRQAED